MSKKGRNINDSEKSLWQKVVEGVTPWHPETEKNKQVQKPAKIKTAARQSSSHSVLTAGAPEQSVLLTKSLDRKTEQKLTKGKMPIEATLDLHGMTQEQAHKALEGFVTRAYHSGKRCVLVITGKGSNDQTGFAFVSERREKGILRARLPEWLAMIPLRDIVLRHTAAVQKHGGSGAFYIYLKNNKK